MFDECLYFNLAALNRRIGKIWHDAFMRLGLSPSHGYLLFAIVEKPEASQKELSEILELDASTVTRLIDGLARKGMIDKTKRGKGATFNVTADGRRTYGNVKKTMDNLYAGMQKHFGARAFESFVDDLHAARRSFSEQ